MYRRHFLRSITAAAGWYAATGPSFRRDKPNGVPKFSATLPGLGPDHANNFGNYIPVLSPDTMAFPGTDYYQILVQQFTQTLHPEIGASRFWGYSDARKPHSGYLGGVIVAKQGCPVKLKVTNSLPPQHILPVDPTAIAPPIADAIGGRVDRITVHLHGGIVPWTSDGAPCSWFSNAANPGGFSHGASFVNRAADNSSAIYDYPNAQSARFVWYHDHAYGITRLNAYAGLASAYIITDDVEWEMIKSGILPEIPGYPFGIPLIIQDKSFFDPDADSAYPVTSARKGDIWYPYAYHNTPIPQMKLPAECGKVGRWKVSGGTPPPVSLVPDAFFDTNLVNGAPYPVLRVSPRRYRFRLLNAAQARFYNLQLYTADRSSDGITLGESSDIDNHGNRIRVPRNPAGPRIIQIGKDSGFLPVPVVLNDPPQPIGFLSTKDNDPKNGNANRYNLLLAPGERADIIVDFRGFEGQSIILYNDAPAPFPVGDVRNDHYPGAPDLTCIGGAAPPVPGRGPDTRTVMRFEVRGNGSVKEPDFNATVLGLASALAAAYRQTQPLRPTEESEPKIKTLDEGFDSHGRLRQQLGSPEISGYLSMPVDIAYKGEAQVWQIYNLTGDTHPIHLHLANVQIVKRESWASDSDGKPVFPLRPVPGTARPPDLNEIGWKETVRMNPGEVTTIIMKFDMPAGAQPSPRLQADYGIQGAEYAWNCHILEREEHDMMHALVIM